MRGERVGGDDACTSTALATPASMLAFTRSG
jgi:hypothetical protein